MKKYIFKRVLLLAPMLFVVSALIFFMLRLNGTDAVTSYLIASGLAPSQETIAQARQNLGLDLPILEQYARWIKAALALDFGKSFITGRDISRDVAYYLPNTLKLVGAGLLLTLFVSIPLGILSAVYKDKFVDNAVRVFAFIGVSVPNFWLGFLLIIFFCVKLDLLPPFGGEGAASLILPAITISFMSIAVNTRLIRANMLEIAGARHVLYAKMRRVSKLQIVLNHIFRNAALPIITAIGMHLGELIGGALVIENVFAYPGLGKYAVEAIATNDYPVIQCFILIMASAFILANLVIDLFYAYIDPRVRLK
ncbi:MAG: ABC transporter permease subunit [Helicobacteraceae bacterium]